jgi:ankyrin repeat protein
MKQQSPRIIRFALVLAMALSVVYAPALVDWVVERPSPNVRLYTAIGSRDLAAFDAAVAEGASVHAHTEDGSFPLTCAAALGQLEMTRRLIAAGVDVDATEVTGTTPLMAAAGQDHVEVVELLICYGADVWCRDRLHRTALDWANDHDSLRVAQVLRRAERQSLESNVIARDNGADSVMKADGAALRPSKY